MKQTKTSSTPIARSAGIVSIAVMFSRVLGLIREQVFAGLFGAGTAYDAFVVAFRIPNLLRDLFAEGALSTAFVKVFTTYDQTQSKKETWQLASIVLVFFACLLSGISLIAIFFSKDIVKLFAPKYAFIPGKMELTVIMTQIMMPFLIFISLAAVLMGILNTKGRFFIPSLASCFFNLGSIIGGTSLALILPHWGIQSIIGMAIGTLIGGVLQLAIQVPALYRTGFSFSLSFNFRHPGLIHILKLMIPAIIGLSATQINVFINTSFASSCAEGSVSWLQYAFRLVQLPIGIFGVAIGTAAMPVLSRCATHKDMLGLKTTFISSLTMVFSMTVPASAGLFLLAEPIIRLIFEHGAFSASATHATAQALSLYAIGLFAYSANKVVVPVFYALEKTFFPVLASFIAIITNICFINIFIDDLHHLAIALSMSITMIINFFFLCSILYKNIGGYDLRLLILSLLKILAATGCMSLFIAMSTRYTSGFLSGNRIQITATLVAIIVIAVLIYSAIMSLLQVKEFSTAALKIKEKLFSSKKGTNHP